MQVFEDRRDAGRQLARELAARADIRDAGRAVVLGVPRGGLPVGAEVARTLDAAFDVVVVRKLRSPANPELGFGAVGAGGYVDIDRDMVARLRLTEAQVEAEVRDRQETVRKRLEVYRSVVPAADFEGAVVVVVDDGVATGGTARQACAFARRGGAEKVILAVPVAPDGTRELLAADADDVVVLSTPAEFMAVGQAYADFAQLTDEDAIEALRRATAAA